MAADGGDGDDGDHHATGSRQQLEPLVPSLGKERWYFPWMNYISRPAGSMGIRYFDEASSASGVSSGASSCGASSGSAAPPADLFLELDERYLRHVGLKSRTIAESRDEVVVSNSNPATMAAKFEVLELVVNFLVKHHPEWFVLRENGNADNNSDAAADDGNIVQTARHKGRRIENKLTGRTFNVTPPLSEDPLVIASLLVQEDLVLLQPEPNTETGQGEQYEITAAVVCFPARWNLREKFGNVMARIHKHVPHYQKSLVKRVDGFFRSIEEGSSIATRGNWFVFDAVQGEYDLFTPMREAVKFAANGMASAEDCKTDHANVDKVYLRVERQTLRRLKAGRAILFTIRTYQHHISVLNGFPTEAQGLLTTLEKMDEETATYMSVHRWRAAVTEFLNGVVKNKKKNTTNEEEEKEKGKGVVLKSQL